MEITININQLEGLIQAINNLAGGVGGGKSILQPPVNNIQPPVAAQSVAPVTAAPGQGGFIPQQVGQPNNFTPNLANAAMQTVPGASQQFTQQPAQNVQVTTAQTTYTIDDLTKAAVSLMDSGKQQDLLNLLAQFSVASLPEVPKEQYGTFATALRGLGAQI